MLPRSAQPVLLPNPLRTLMTNKRKRRVGVGSVAPSTDVNAGVHVSAVANPSTIAAEYHLHDVPKAKKPRNTTPTASPSDAPLEDDPQPQKAKRKQVHFFPASTPTGTYSTTLRGPQL